MAQGRQLWRPWVRCGSWVPALLPPLVTQGEIGTETMRLGIAEDRTTTGGIDPTGTTGENGDQPTVAAWEC